MTHRILPLSAIVLAVTLSLSGCFPLGGPPTGPTNAPTTSPTESETAVDGIDVTASASAVTALGGRVVGAEVTPTLPGIGNGLLVEFEVVGAEPLTPAELEAVMTAARDSAPFDPAGMDVVAWTPQDDGNELAVDTWTAAGAIFVNVGAYPGGIGVSRVELNRAFGPWPGSGE